MTIVERLKQQVQPIVAFLIAFVFIIGLELIYKDQARDGIYYQPWTSDRMMQTMPSNILKERPLQALWYNHIQPPMLDTIRAIGLLFISAKDKSEKELLYALDSSMLYVWAIFFALLSTLVFYWVRKLDKKYAWLVYAFWVPFPACVLFATFLESTLLSGLMIAFMFFQFWRIRKDPKTSLVPLTLTVIFLFLLRTTFQWYFLLPYVVVLFILGVPKKRLFISFGAISLVIGAFLTKQSILFQTTSTTSYAGEHYCGMMWVKPSDPVERAAIAALDYTYPKGALEVTDTRYHFNTQYNAEKNIALTKICKEIFRKAPFEKLGLVLTKSVPHNFRRFLRPTSKHLPNVILDGSFYRRVYDKLFSHKYYLMLAFIAFGLWVYGAFFAHGEKITATVWKEALKDASLSLPFFYVFTLANLANRFEWVESERLKFFIEPTFFIFLAFQFYRFKEIFIKLICYIRLRFGQKANGREVQSS
jgi:MFS family permease